MASEFPALPNWRMDNNLGSLQFLQFGGLVTATRVTIATAATSASARPRPARRCTWSIPRRVPAATPSSPTRGIFCYIARAPLRSASASSTVFVGGTSSTTPSASSRSVTRPAAPRPSCLPRRPGQLAGVESTGIGINNAFPVFPIHHASGARLTVGGVWTNASSRSLKTAFEAIDPLAVLDKVADLPVQGWRYKVEDASTRHIGPVAEDFQRLFGLGDGESIGTVDANGVALAAIQGLVQKMDQAFASKDAEIAELRQELRSLKASMTSKPAPKVVVNTP